MLQLQNSFLEIETVNIGKYVNIVNYVNGPLTVSIVDNTCCHEQRNYLSFDYSENMTHHKCGIIKGLIN